MCDDKECGSFYKVLGFLVVLVTNAFLCHAQNNTDDDNELLEHYVTNAPVEVYRVSWTSNSSLWILIVCIGGVIATVIVVMAFSICRRTLWMHLRSTESTSPRHRLIERSRVLELQDMELDNDNAETPGTESTEVDLPPSYSKCVRSGMITSTSSFLNRIWGDNSSQAALPDYETALMRRGLFEDSAFEDDTGIDFEVNEDESGINIQVETDSDDDGSVRGHAGETDVVVHFGLLPSDSGQ
ncbi:uncharacterized protein [Ptychodera flava]|uniref:uncharacterized protein n=1 Tax=Ptychodera flava TaxID=63121 RepID=UPI00396A1F88